jgi:cytochrome P450
MVFSPFSNGIRSCLGKYFALLETKIMVYSLLQKYNIKLKQGYIHLLKTGALY